MTIAVVGLGQRFAGDDGVGLRVLDELRVLLAGRSRVRPRALADTSEVVALYAAVSELIIVDAVLDHAEPGSISLLAPAELAGNTQLSSHGVALVDALALAAILHPSARPNVSMVAVSIARADRRLGLSPAVSRAVPRACNRVLELVDRRRGAFA